MARRPELGSQDDGALLVAGARRNALLDAMKASGQTTLRANAIYGQVRRDGQYDFSALDSLVNEARSRGIKTQLTVMGTPRYLEGRGLDMGLSYRSADPRAAGQFANAVARHFGDRVDRYSAWNEPNLPTFLADRSPKRYRAIYQAMRQGFKGADPTAQVLLGELMPGNSQNANPRDRAHAENFLRRVFAGGSKPLRAEGLAIHPYGFGGRAAGVEGGPSEYFGINQLRDANRFLAEMQREGRFQTTKGGRVPLYLTEYGLQRSAVKDPHKRATYLARAYRAAQDAGARQMIFYQVAPTRGSGTWDTATDPRHIRAALARIARR